MVTYSDNYILINIVWWEREGVILPFNAPIIIPAAPIKEKSITSQKSDQMAILRTLITKE